MKHISLLLIFSMALISCGISDNDTIEDPLLPNTIIVLSDHVDLDRDSIVLIKFRVFPDHYNFNYNVDSSSSNIELLCINEEEKGVYKHPNNFTLKSVISDNKEKEDGIYTAIIEELPTCENTYVDKVVFRIKNENKEVVSDTFTISSSNCGKEFLRFTLIDSNEKEWDPFIQTDSSYTFCVSKAVDTNNMKAHFRHNGERVYVNGVEQISCISNNSFTSEVSYTVKAMGGESSTYIIKVIPCDLPAISIQTSGNEPVVSKESWIEESSISLWDVEGCITNAGATKIRCRGNASMRFPKKSYAIKLDKKKDLLGMPEDKRWDLLGNYRDRTNLRNDISFYLARQCSGLEWTPRMEFCELFINGEHLGLYALTEHIKISKNRVNIEKLEINDEAEDIITGGYLLEIDSYYDEINKFVSKHRKLPYMIKEPDDELNSKQFSYIQGFIDEFEDALYLDDSFNSYNNYIDVTSFVDWWLIQELTGSEESRQPHSSYMYKKRNGKLYAGPVWDFDWPTFIPDLNIIHNSRSLYYLRLMEDSCFVTTIKDRWNTNKDKFKYVLNSIIDKEADKIRFSESRNSKLWPIQDDVVRLFNGDEHLSFDESIQRMKLALSQRIDWLDIALNDL